MIPHGTWAPIAGRDACECLSVTCFTLHAMIFYMQNCKTQEDNRRQQISLPVCNSLASKIWPESMQPFLAVMYHNAVQGGPSHDHKQHAEEIWGSSAMCFFRYDSGRQTDMLASTVCTPPMGEVIKKLQLLRSFNGLFSRTTWVSQHQKSRTIPVKTIWVYWSKRQWVAMASAAWYANLHLAPDR